MRNEEKDISLLERFEYLIRSIKDSDPKADTDIVYRAFEFAKLAHVGEKRKSGIDAIWHPLETAIILKKWNMDIATVTAGLLHDTIEHGAATREDVQEYFGDEILALVEGVTKVSKIKLVGSGNEYFVENLRKMFLAIAKDLRIVFLRLAERVDNLKTLQYLPKDRIKNFATDSLEIYAPLAERLGMWKVKTQIDDLAFQYAYPEVYKKVLKDSKPYYQNAEKRMQEIQKKLTKALKKEGVDATIVSRKKGLYSLWKKLEREEIKWNFDEIRDIVAARILVKEVNECYVALGVLHKIYKPIPHIAISDFIAVPKPNGYRSIHTKVFGPGDKPIEVQIRTFEMHEEAEFGAAAHWNMSQLKSSGKISSEDIDKGNFSVSQNKLSWVKELAEWQKEIKSSEEFLEAVKFDALSRRIFVFSPKGDVFDLPENATPVDFAYAVHTGLGKFLKGAKVDGKVVSLDHKLQNGQVVEILKTKEERKPNADWLKFVVTTLAKREIKKKLKLTKIDKK